MACAPGPCCRSGRFRRRFRRSSSIAFRLRFAVPVLRAPAAGPGPVHPLHWGPGFSPSRWRACPQLPLIPHLALFLPLSLRSPQFFAQEVTRNPAAESLLPATPCDVAPQSEAEKTPRRQCVRTGQRSDRLQRQMCPKKRRIRLSRRAKTSGMSRWRSARCRDYRKKDVAEITGGLSDTRTEQFATKSYFAVRFIRFGAWMSSLKI